MSSQRQQAPQEGGDRPHKLRTAMVLLVVSYIVGWPVVGAIAVAGYSLDLSALALYAAPACYGLSWLMMLLAFYIGGPETAVRLKMTIRRWRSPSQD